MLKIEKTIVDGWEAAIRGMRNPLNSWDKSDTRFNWEVGKIVIGENDLALMKKLSKAGSDHAKFLRMINVTVDITAPLYWWKEFDTYKVGTVANSCSTMHTIHKKPFELSDFSWEHLTEANLKVLEWLIDVLNANREKYNATKNKEDWLQMIQLLPTSYEQKRTVQLNYQVLKNIYHSRKNHKLAEWHVLCAWIEKLPYFMEVCDVNT
jgi:hypothetical protein